MKTSSQKLSAWVDGALPADEHARIEADLRNHPELQADVDAMTEIGEALRAEPVCGWVTSDQMWQDVQRSIRLGEGTKAPWWSGAWMRAGAVATACAVFAAVLLPGHAVEFTEIKYVESALSDVSTMVYTDHEAGWTVVWLDGADLETMHER